MNSFLVFVMALAAMFFAGASASLENTSGVVALATGPEASFVDMYSEVHAETGEAADLEAAAVAAFEAESAAEKTESVDSSLIEAQTERRRRGGFFRRLFGRRRRHHHRRAPVFRRVVRHISRPFRGIRRLFGRRRGGRRAIRRRGGRRSIRRPRRVIRRPRRVIRRPRITKLQKIKKARIQRKKQQIAKIRKQVAVAKKAAKQAVKAKIAAAKAKIFAKPKPAVVRAAIPPVRPVQLISDDSAAKAEVAAAQKAADKARAAAKLRIKNAMANAKSWKGRLKTLRKQKRATRRAFRAKQNAKRREARVVEEALFNLGRLVRQVRNGVKEVRRKKWEIDARANVYAKNYVTAENNKLFNRKGYNPKKGPRFQKQANGQPADLTTLELGKNINPNDYGRGLIQDNYAASFDSLQKAEKTATDAAAERPGILQEIKIVSELDDGADGPTKAFAEVNENFLSGLIETGAQLENEVAEHAQAAEGALVETEATRRRRGGFFRRIFGRRRRHHRRAAPARRHAFRRPSFNRRPVQRRPANRRPANRRPANRRPANRRPASRRPANRRPAGRPRPTPRRPAQQRPRPNGGRPRPTPRRPTQQRPRPNGRPKPVSPVKPPRPVSTYDKAGALARIKAQLQQDETAAKKTQDKYDRKAKFRQTKYEILAKENDKLTEYTNSEDQEVSIKGKMLLDHVSNIHKTAEAYDKQIE